MDKDFNWLVEDPKNTAFCKVCGIKLTIAGGKVDLIRHAQTSKHQKNASAICITPSVTNSIKNLNNLKTNSNDAAIKIAFFCVEHNLSFNTMDHMVHLQKDLFPDSEIAQHTSCSRTKTTAIVKNVISQEQLSNLIILLNSNKFSLIADESTDKSNKKLLSLVVRVANDNDLYINDYLLCLLEVSLADAETLYLTIVKYFTDNGINYKENLIGFAADGANVMTGKNNSLATKLKADVPNLVILKCVCHSMALCSSYACKKLPKEIEQLVRDIYNFIGNSPKRANDFDEIQKLFDD